MNIFYDGAIRHGVRSVPALAFFYMAKHLDYFWNRGKNISAILLAKPSKDTGNSPNNIHLRLPHKKTVFREILSDLFLDRETLL